MMYKRLPPRFSQRQSSHVMTFKSALLRPSKQAYYEDITQKRDTDEGTTAYKRPKIQKERESRIQKKKKERYRFFTLF